MDMTLTLKNLTMDQLDNLSNADINAFHVEQALKVLNEYRPRIDDPLAQALIAELFGVLK